MNLTDVLALLSVDDLKRLTRHLPGPPVTGRKAELVAGITRMLLGPDLQSLWHALDANGQAAVAEAVYDPLGQFNAVLFRAKYKTPAALVNAPERAGGQASLPMSLFIYRIEERGGLGVPADLRARLLQFVPKPPSAQVVSSLELDPDDDRLVRLTELEAVQELTLMLRCIEQERITVGEKTAQPSTATQRLLTARLVNGDFYPWVEKEDKYDQQVGPIKAFAWPMLLQAGGLAKRTGTRLGLSPAGIKALTVAPVEVIGKLWDKWLSNSLLDEFSRVETIKGQNSPGRVMSAVAPRRDAIQQALQECPVGRWISVDEFSRFMQASDLLFEVTRDPWKLYISDRQYGSLGYAGSHDWAILQQRYILTVLFEYASTLGLIDVAFYDPTGPQWESPDMGDMWGTEDLLFLSRYDGLAHFRINALGAYVLGLTEDYQAQLPVSAMRLNVLPSLSIGVVAGSPDTVAQMMLDTWAQSLPDGLWRLDQAKALAALEKGHDITLLQSFLQDHSSAPLPESVATFVANCQRDASAVKLGAAAVLMNCRDAATAARIAEHSSTQRLCWRLDAKTLVVRADQQDKFRQALGTLGLGLA